MKKAKVADHWRRLGEKPVSNSLCWFSSSSIDGFPETAVKLEGALTVLTGLNGVGKSTILNAIRLLVGREISQGIELSVLKNANGLLSGEVLFENERIPITTRLEIGKITVSPETISLGLTWIDASFEIPFLIKSIREEQNFDEALAQFEAAVYDDAELKDISWLVGKTYDSCSVFELEDFYNRPVVPYFQVSSSGSNYGMECMGLGEAALHFIFWALKRCPQNSIILIEEPETFVSVRSQGALMDLLARTCLTKNCTAIVTTHSPEIFSKVPPRQTLICTRTGGTVNIVVKEDPDARMLALSVPRTKQKSGFLIVEDRLAREFSKYWITHYSSLTTTWKIIDVGSSSNIINCIKHFPKNTDDWFRVIGLFDGDERGKHKADSNYCFLPTSQPPDKILQSIILNYPDEIASHVGVERSELDIAFTTIDGLDHHDWFIDLCACFEGKGVSYEDFVMAGVETWIKYNESASSSAYQELHDLIDRNGMNRPTHVDTSVHRSDSMLQSAESTAPPHKMSWHMRFMSIFKR